MVLRQDIVIHIPSICNMSNFDAILNSVKQILYAHLPNALRKHSNIGPITDAATQLIMDDRMWTVTDFTPDQQVIIKQLFITPVSMIHTPAHSPRSIPTPNTTATASSTAIPIEWLNSHRRSLLVGLPGSIEYIERKKYLDSRSEPLTRWNPKHTLESHDQQKVMNYIHNYRTYQADDGIRTFRQNITDIAMYGIKASLTRIKDNADWPKDDDEELIAAILFHYG